MQVDVTNQDDVQTGTTMMQVLGWLAAVLPAAVGLATIGVSGVNVAPYVQETDGNDQRGPGTAVPAETLVTPAGELDRALQRPDRGNDQHS